MDVYNRGKSGTGKDVFLKNKSKREEVLLLDRKDIKEIEFKSGVKIRIQTKKDLSPTKEVEEMKKKTGLSDFGKKIKEAVDLSKNSFETLVQKVRSTPLEKRDIINLVRYISTIPRCKLITDEEVGEYREKHQGHYPRGSILFGGLCAVHIPSKYNGNRGEPSKADLFLFYEVRKKIKEYDNRNMREIKKSHASDDLRKVFSGQVGLYKIFFPASKGRRRSREGRALLELHDLNQGKNRQPFKVISILNGAGSLDWMSDAVFELGLGKFYVPYYSVQNNALPKHLVNKPIMKEYTKKTISALRAAAYHQYKKRNEKEVK